MDMIQNHFKTLSYHRTVENNTIITHSIWNLS